MKDVLTQIILPFLFAMAVVSMVHPRLVNIAVRKSIVDNPNARKLNKEPVPVLGGVGVYFGVLLAVCIFSWLSGVSGSFVVFTAATIMLYTGVKDDIVNIRVRSKFFMQIFAVAILIFVGGFQIDNFHGLFGIHELPQWASIPLTFVACVGLINGVNLIDGVDGLSSGYAMVTSVVCGAVFWLIHDAEFTVLCFSIVGALIPFFIHNVFGRKYKMFMGDGGSLVLGTLFVVMIMQIDQGGATPEMKGVVSFLVAAFSFPLCDTIRVMMARMLRGKSPFSPDKTHMHHIFIDMGYNHPATTLITILINLLPLAVWFATEKIAFISVNAQFVIVVGFSFLLNFCLCYGFERYKRCNPEKYEDKRSRIMNRQIKREGIFKTVQRKLDSF